MNTVASLPVRLTALVSAWRARNNAYHGECADELEDALASPAPSAGVGVDKLLADVLAVIPGGDYCDPQQVADDVREVFAALQHPAAPSVSPAVEGGLDSLLSAAEEEIREYAARTSASRFPQPESLRGWARIIASARSAIRRLATPEQPGSAVQAAPAGVDCLELLPWSDFWQRQGRPDVSHNFAAFELAEAWATACISAATPPPAPEQGVACGKCGVRQPLQHSPDCGRTQPEARGVEELPAQWDEMARSYTGDVRLMLTTCAAELRLRLAATPNPVRAEQPSINPAPVDSKLIGEQPDSRSRMRRIAIEKGEPVPRFDEQPEGKEAGVVHRGLWWIVLMGAFQIGPLFATEGEANEHAANFNAMLAATPAAPGAAVGVDEDGR